MSETPNYADRIAAEAGELDRVYAETLSQITAREVETIARRLRSLAGEMRDSAPPSPGDVTGPAPDPSLDVMLLNEAAAVLERDRHVGVTPSTVASCGEMIAAIRRAVGRLNDAENVSRGDVTGPTPTEDEPYQRVAAVVGDDLAALRACAEAWEPDVRLLGNVRASTIAALCIELEQFRTQNVSRGDVTGTPALRDALWQATYALDRAYLHAHAFPRGCIQGCPHRACVDDPCECGYEAGLAKIYAAVRAGQRVLKAAALSEIDTQGSRPDLTGETPPASESLSDLEWLESKLTLHNGVELLYVVDGYEVLTTTHDGNRVERSCRAATLSAAIQQHRNACGGPPPETTREALNA